IQMTGAWTNHLWQSTLFAIVAGLFTLLFRKNRAGVRYWLWLSASMRFLLPFAVLISLGSRFEWPRAAERVATETVTFTMAEIAAPFSGAAPIAPSHRPARDWRPVAIV